MPWLLAIHLIILLLFSWLPGRFRKYALLVFYLELVYFFFGALQDFLKEHWEWLSRYSHLLPLLLLLIPVIWWLLRSRTALPRTFLYSNSLLLLLLTIELVSSLLIAGTGGQSRQWFGKRTSPLLNTSFCDTCQRPDIYFIVFDGYSASRTLKSYWDYDNSHLDSFFRQKGFFYADHSTSNYNSTPFSVGSILNMDYHRKKLNKKIDLIDFCEGMETIHNNLVCQLLEKHGYTLINQSYFALPHQPPPLNFSYLTDKTEIFLAQTFWKRIYADIGWHFFPPRQPSPATVREQIQNEKHKLDQLKKTSTLFFEELSRQRPQPAFVYTHFLLPHDPYFYDSTGSLTPPESWISPKAPKERYLSQLKYTNTLIRDAVNKLLAPSDRPRIIILQSDHGFRSFEPAPGNQHQALEFNNLNAIYFPDQDYSSLNDSMSSVNTFRLVLNKYFETGFPLLKDSSTYIGHH